MLCLSFTAYVMLGSVFANAQPRCTLSSLCTPPATQHWHTCIHARVRGQRLQGTRCTHALAAPTLAHMLLCCSASALHGAGSATPAPTSHSAATWRNRRVPPPALKCHHHQCNLHSVMICVSAQTLHAKCRRTPAASGAAAASSNGCVVQLGCPHLA